MRMAFAKIVTDCRLVNEMEMVPSIMLPLMRVTIEIGPGMFSFGKKFQQRRPITHALDGTHAAVGIRVEVTKDEGWLIRSFIELLGEPVSTVRLPETPFLPESNSTRFACGSSITPA